ncbi:MAG: tRNA (guanosine(37)-N1)-methyltransferase TrmD [Oscillospiraceae bacterium]|nr:tRNA (guanosine(37)-N1)-methyltransferase TrmD [Oscillospiraceae bacterium]
MRIDIATLFTDMCDSVLHESIVGRGIKNGFIEIYTHDIRDYTENRHRKVDDKPYGGGTGMVMQAQPVYDCVMDIISKHEKRPRVIYMSPQGETLTQEKVKELAAEDGLILLCGHYEGIDQRVLDELECEELSIGDYVLTGGELPALIVADAVARLQKGVLPNEDAYSIESHYNGLLEHPQYTMPREWRGREVPIELTLGNHEVISEWQRKAALRVTAEKRPDMHEIYMDRLVQEFWDGFISAKGLDDDTDYTQIFRVGSNEGESNRLLKRVLRGKKRATTCLYTDDDILPEKGEYCIITDWDGVPRCVTKVTRVQVIPFNKITLEQALKEGEDTTLEAWRDTHREVYARNAEQLDFEFSDDSKIIYEEFRVEYKE